jgi:hypothetical protein
MFTSPLPWRKYWGNAPTRYTPLARQRCYVSEALFVGNGNDMVTQVNLVTLGHVDHGKITLVAAISGIWPGMDEPRPKHTTSAASSE